MRSHLHASHPAPRETGETVHAQIPSPTPKSITTKSTTTFEKIPLNRLDFAPAGRRKLGRQSIQMLAARIHSAGQIQSLMVTPTENSGFQVVAGERRFAALRLLARQGSIPPSFPVPCRIVQAKVTTEVSAVTDFDAAALLPETDERRRRFLALRNRCPGLLTGSELADRQCCT
jgi:ParB-like nuclease domain